MVYHLLQIRSPLKTNVDIRFGNLLSTDGQQVFLGASTHNAQAQQQLRPLSRATKTLVLLRAKNTGYAPGIGQARTSDVPETTNAREWKNVWSTNPPCLSMVKAMGM